MSSRIRGVLRDNSGGISIVFVGFAFALIVIAAVFLELGAAYERHDYVVDVITRAATTAVESTLDDEYRQDNIRKFQMAAGVGDQRFILTKNAFLSRLDLDLSDKYHLNISDFEYAFTETPPQMTVTGTGSFETIFSGLGFGDIHFSFSVSSKNYDTTDFDLDK